MSAAPPAARPPVPSDRPPVPGATPPRATVPSTPVNVAASAPIPAAIAAAIAPSALPPTVVAAPVVAAPVVAAPVVAAPAPTVAPIAAAPVTATVATEVAKPTVAKKKGKPAGTLAPYWGLFATAVNPLTGVNEYLQDAGPVNADGTPGPLVQRRQRIVGVPAIVAYPANTDDAGFDPEKNEAIKPTQFEKLGDYYRFQSTLYTYKSAKALRDAVEADAGKKGMRGSSTVVADRVKSQMDALLAVIASQVSPEQLATIKEKFNTGLTTPVATSPTT